MRSKKQIFHIPAFGIVIVQKKENQFDLTFTHGRLLYLCELHPEVDAAYQAWLGTTKKPGYEPV